MRKNATKPCGCPLLLRKFYSDVQAYLKVLSKAGTAISVPVVIAAAEGVVTARNHTLC